MITMLDVARRAGVSKATVSRVLNATGQVRQSTRSAVFCAMEELGYRPNLLAQALANQTSNTLGLVISHFDGPYFGRLLRQAAAQVEASGKQLIVTDGHDTPDGERQAVQMLSDRRCDAIILYTRFMAETDLMKLVSQYPSLVVINRALPQAAQRCILFEQRAAARQAVEYLIERGHRRIACITLTIDTPTGQARLQGYHDALQAHALSASPRTLPTAITAWRADTTPACVCWRTTMRRSAPCSAATMIWPSAPFAPCAKREYASHRRSLCSALTTSPSPPT